MMSCRVVQGVEHEVPRGWEARVDRNTFTVFFVNHDNQVRTRYLSGAEIVGRPVLEFFFVFILSFFFFFFSCFIADVIISRDISGRIF